MGSALRFAFRLGVVLVLVAVIAGAAIGWLAPDGVHISVDDALIDVPSGLHGALTGSIAGLIAMLVVSAVMVIVLLVVPLVLALCALAVAIAIGVVLGPLVLPLLALAALIAFLRRPATRADKMPAN